MVCCFVSHKWLSCPRNHLASNCNWWFFGVIIFSFSEIRGTAKICTVYYHSYRSKWWNSTFSMLLFCEQILLYFTACVGRGSLDFAKMTELNSLGQIICWRFLWRCKSQPVKIQVDYMDHLMLERMRSWVAKVFNNPVPVLVTIVVLWQMMGWGRKKERNWGGSWLMMLSIWRDLFVCFFLNILVTESDCKNTGLEFSGNSWEILCLCISV